MVLINRNLIRLVFYGCFFVVLSGFTLLSGPSEATLPVSEQDNTLTFYWTGEAPSIDDKEDFEGGIYTSYSDEDFMRELLNIAVAKWNTVPGSYLQIVVAEDSSVSLNTDDQQFVIAVTSVGATAAASALPNIEESSIIDCDISIGSKSTSATSLARTIVHEFGHCIGLGHNHTNYGAIMGYSNSTSESYSLGLDDMAGLIYLYPDRSVGAGDYKEVVCGSISMGKKPKAYIALALLFPCFIAFTRKRRLLTLK